MAVPRRQNGRASNSHLRGSTQHISRPRSLVSIASSNCSEASRRRSALLEMDSPFRNSLQRAQEALRASERGRNEDERRSRSRSTTFAEPPPEARRRSPPSAEQRHRSDYPTHDRYDQEEERGNRSGHKLHKSRSIPLNLLTSPTPQLARTFTTHDNTTISPPLGASKPRRATSHGDLLASPDRQSQPQPVSILRTSPKYIASRAAPQPSRLPVPDPEPTSKFSCSSNESKLDTFNWTESFRLRARTLSTAASFRIKKTPSRLALTKKSSLATLLDDVMPSGSNGRRTSEDQGKPRHSVEDRRPSSQIPISARTSTSSYSRTPTSPSVISDRPRRGFFRGALKDLARAGSLRGSGSSSHTRSASNSSVSASSLASKRVSDISSKAESEKRGGWLSRLGKRVEGTKVAARVEEIESGISSPVESSSPTIVHLAEKVQVPSSDAPIVAIQSVRAPSRIPISAIFPHATMREQRRRAPSRKRDSSDDTTFYGHSITRHRGSRSHRRSSIPIASARPLKRPSDDSRSLSHRANGPANLSLAPAVHLEPIASTYEPSTGEALDSPVDSSSNEDIYSPPTPSPNRRSFRAPSPARFRDFLPSEPAFSSPEKSVIGLPLPSEGGSPKSLGVSPKKRAMGPEQVIGMVEDLPDEGIVEARGATTDLAALLSDLEETQEIESSVGSKGQSSPQKRRDNFADLSNSLRHYLPKVDSIESIRSDVSDVPNDLQQLIRSISDHIYEVTTIHSMFDEPSFGHHDASATTFGDEESSDEDRSCFDDDEDHAPFSMHHLEATDDLRNVYSGEGSGDGSTTGPLSTESEGGDSTSESFEGHISTAAMALRAMLSGSAPGEHAATVAREVSEDDEVERRSMMRDSVREYLEMERPSVGEKMLDRMDADVPLDQLIHGDSPAMSRNSSAQDQQRHLRNQSMVSSSEGSSECGMGSPTPASGQALTRHSMVRYSQDRSRRQPHRRGPSTLHDSSGDEAPLPEEPTTHSAAHSSRSTNLSISSLHSSPCPAPRNRRIPMLTRRTPTVPHFHFPPLPSNDSTLRGAPPSPWTQTHASSSPTRKQQSSSSPFTKLFNPLEEFRARGSKRDSGTASEEDSTGEVELQEALDAPSPRFGRPTPPNRAIPTPFPLSAQLLSNVFVPPDTPPPSSPSLYASDSDRSSQLSAVGRPSFDLERSQHPPIVTARSMGHSRQISRTSSLIRETIQEDERETLISPVSSPTMQLPLPPPISPIVLEQRPLESIEEPQSPEPVIVVATAGEKELSAPIRLDHGPHTFNLTFAPAHAPRKENDQDEEMEEPLDELYTLMDDDETQLAMKGWMHFTYEAEAELRRSMARWPDTEASLSALHHFKRPTTTHDILQFLFDSQRRFRSLAPYGSHLTLPGLPSPDIYPSHALSPPTPMVSVDGSNSKSPHELVVISPPSPSPIIVKAPRRMPLGAKPVNRQLVLTKSTSSPQKEEPALSPFTALPPKLGIRSKLRSKLTSSSPTKKVDLSFLGSGKPVSQRRKNALDAARRKLEGLSVPEQVDGPSDSEDTGVLEAKGEGGSIGFAKTPKLTTSRPRVRRRQGLSMLR